MTNKAKKVALGIILLVMAGIVTGLLMWNMNQGDSENYVVGGKYSHLYYNTGTITSVDTGTKTFFITVEDVNRDHIYEEYVEVYYAGNAVFLSGSTDDLAEGVVAKVGYLRPINEYPIQAMSIEL